MTTFYHERMPNQPGIYRITCTITGKFYIGSATNLRERRKEHFRSLEQKEHHNIKLQRAWDKHGRDAFTFEILELILIPELLTAREQHYFDKLKPFGSKGFNIAKVAGSTLGRECSPETRKKIGDANRGKPSPTRGKRPSPEAIEKHRQAMLGKKQTEEHKRKRAESQIGKKRSPETREKMRIAALGHVVSDETRAKIGAKSIGRVKSAESIERISLANKERVRTSEEYASRRKKLLAIAPDGTEYIVDGTLKFAKEHGLDSSSLIKVAKGKQSHTKGWKIRYLEEC